MYICVYIEIYIHHKLYIHSSINGPLGCFHILAIVHYVVLNMAVHISFGGWYFDFLQINTQGWNFWIPQQFFFLTFLGNSVLFSIMATPIENPINHS